MEIALIYTENDIWAFGLRSLSAVLKQAGHRTKIIIAKGMNGALLSEQTLVDIGHITKGCRIVGVSSFSMGSDKARQICCHLKKHSPETLLVWGGMHATMNPADCAQHADVVCVGEGEDFLLDLITCVQNGEPYNHLPNAAYLEKGTFKANDVRPPINDLDTLPFLDFLFEDEYHLSDDVLARVEEINDPTIPIMFNGTRGCAFSCNYCSNSQIKDIYKGKGRYVRKMSPEKYIQAIRNMRARFPQSKYYNLVDEDFFAYTKEKIERFAELYKKYIKIPFECMGSPRNAHREKIAPLVDAGLWRVNMGVESGSERTKKEVYNRHITNEEVVRASQVIDSFKTVILNCFIIIGNPYEKNADLLETVALFKRMAAPYFLTIYNLIFFPGTPLYRMALDDRIISGKSESGYEMNFLAGYNYQDHGWKNQNLYMNGLIYMMMGKVTWLRMGLVPRGVLPLLLHPYVIAFNDRHPVTIKAFVYFKQKLWRVRSALIRLLKRWVPNPASLNRQLAHLFLAKPSEKI